MTLDRAWETPAELARRVAGASWVLTRATVRMPWPAPPRPLRRLFRGHLARPSDERFALAVPEAWPDRAVWLTAVDLMSGRRVALGRRPADRHSLTMRRAAIAATAFAGLLAPVRDGRRTLVDGGVHSVTNLDIAARCDGNLVVCLAPMAFDPRRPPGPLAQAMRTRSNVDLLRERTALEWLGKTLLGLRPGRDELRGQSANPLRSTRPDQLYSAAYDQCRRSLATERRWSALTELAAA